MTDISLEWPICDSLRDLVPLVQFKKREKHPWRSDTFRRCFSRFLDSVNGTKSRKALHMVMIVRIQFDQLVYID